MADGLERETARREHRRQELLHELTVLSDRLEEIMLELARYEPALPPRWRDPMQLDLPLSRSRRS
jgi:hypothetical protein